ncbi:Uma2 family endonuclease [Nocardia amikacinitolerans]|uniref:Uma2 family endonuclease n=1 Tax=Nocardia amikacinitolerans TaxID=756689 RepID=UPI0020A3C5BD|nr:Uma2 family endonuclease [Nocardia amikacinitolerans]MCP2291838.1 Endonuclease, Uma2 family (restriction endonuclease fold) [Nocardia amikacinitolerans]
MTVEPLPDWVVPPPGGYTVDAFLELRGLPKHTELIDGALVFVSPQEKWHRQVLSLLRRELDLQAPAHLRADREMAVRLGKRQMPEPDVLVVTTEAFERKQPSSYYFAEDLVLAVEAVSPDSLERDRETKPLKYAKAGLPHYWRVERDEDDRAVVYAYDLDPVSERYVPIGIFHDRLKVSVPFPIDIDLTTIGQRG